MFWRGTILIGIYVDNFTEHNEIMALKELYTQPNWERGLFSCIGMGNSIEYFILERLIICIIFEYKKPTLNR